MRRPPQAVQILGSLLFAAAIAVAVVTVHFGTSSAELEAREERLEQRIELRQEAVEREEERGR